MIVEGTARIKGTAILDAEVVWLGLDGVPDFDALHSRRNDKSATACAFDLLMFNGEDRARLRYENFSGMVGAFNMSSMLRAMATNCLLPPANSGLKELSQRN